MNPITVFLTVACLAVGAGLGATGYLYSGVPFVIAAVIIAAALKMANTWQKFVIFARENCSASKGRGSSSSFPSSTTS
jgi:asparagine N-glycosylation enzyme membrane subunit Stt3